MPNLTVRSNDFNVNPFESIKHNEKGLEFWCARELMPLLNYTTWSKFDRVIENAQENLEIVVSDIKNHINPTVNLVKRPQGGGSKQLDYKLSRLACYHIALSCDSRGNNAVKMAKHYFAIKTREAEVIIPQQSEEIVALKLQNELLDKQLKLRELDNTMLTLHGKATVLALRGYDQAIVEVDRPTLEVIDKRSGDRRKGMTCKQLNDYMKTRLGFNFQSGAQLKRFLESKAPELIDIVQRPINQDWIISDNVNKAIQILESMPRRLLLGE